jgi:hypothetical protein
MALTINPAVSGASYRRWSLHVGLFVVGVALGAMVTYAVTRSLYQLLAIAAPASWLAIALPLIALAALRDLGAQVPVPYPARQVPEWLRRVLSPGWTAISYGSQLGTGFLTRYTYATHAAFVALLATQSSVTVVGVAVLAFALTKSIVVVSSLAGRSYSEFEQGLLHRHRTRGQATLRAANAVLALASGAVLVTYLLHR